MNAAARRWRLRERALCRRANRWGANRAVRAGFALASRLGDGPLWVALATALLAAGGAPGRVAFLHLGLVGGLSTLLYRRLKRWSRRPRPFARDPRIRAWVAPLDEFSFPSGHTLHAVGFSLAAIGWFPALAWVLVPAMLAIAASRVVLGMHYPSDVAAAALLGVLLSEGTRPLFATLA